MKRRDLLKAGAAAGASMSWSGCLGILGDGPEGENNDGDGVSVGQDRNDNPEVKDFGYRIDFQDQTGALGHVAQQDYSTDEVYDDLVNEKSEAEWQELDRNDLNAARNILDNNDSSLEQIQPHVQRELETSNGDEPDELAVLKGVGRGIESETLISDSYNSSIVQKALTEHFGNELLDSDVFNIWITNSTLPETEGRFVHSTMSMVYEDDGEVVVDYVEPGAPFNPLQPDDTEAIRRAENSIYAESGEEDYVTGLEFTKALELARNGEIEEEGRAHPYRSISNEIVLDLNFMVSSGRDDFNKEELPPSGPVSVVSQSFGNSVENAFDNLDAQKLQYMENIGRAVQLFYDEKGWNSELGIGGTLESPEIYDLNEEGIERAWEQYGELDMSEFTEQHVEQ